MNLRWQSRWQWMGALVLGVIAGACSVEVVDAEVDDEGDSDVDFRVGPPPPPAVLDVEAQVCPGWRQIARRHASGDCPNIASPNGGWQGSKMFPGWTEANSWAGRYCIYDFLGAGLPQGNDLLALKKPAFQVVAPDCIANTAQTSLDEQLNPELSRLTESRIDAVTGQEIDIDGTASGREGVRVAVVDTTPPVDPANPRDDHGIVVAELITDIAHGCETYSPFCKVVIDNVLGLPRYGLMKADVDTTGRGGFAGFHSDLARGVYTAVRNWELAGGSYKLIINLSVGWLPPFGVAGQSPAVDALQLALQRASCKGAVIIAAAGNDSDDCLEGPLMPAAWEELAAPTATECPLEPIGIAAPVSPGSATYLPLVYSVGGVDYDDEAVSVSRPGGRPRLAAIADHVVGSDLGRTARTGTSMAAATVSGIAALVWSYRDTLTGPEIMELLWDAGVPTGDSSDYSLGGAAYEIRRATACGALSEACATPGDCPLSFNLGCRTTWRSTDTLEATIAAIVPEQTSQVQMLAASFPDETCAEYCGEFADNYYSGGLATTCEPLEGEARTDYLTKPAPGNPACPTCGIITSGDPDDKSTVYEVYLIASLAASYSSQSILAISVDLLMADGTKMTVRIDPAEAALTTTAHKLQLVPDPATPFTSKVESGTISISFPNQVVVGDLLPPVSM